MCSGTLSFTKSSGDKPSSLSASIVDMVDSLYAREYLMFIIFLLLITFLGRYMYLNSFLNSSGAVKNALIISFSSLLAILLTIACLSLLLFSLFFSITLVTYSKCDSGASCISAQATLLYAGGA